MKTPMIGLALFLLVGFWSEAARAQTKQGPPDLVLFKKAYQALDEKLPTGRRVVVMADPFLNGPPARQYEVSQANRAFASAIGLASAPLADVLTCTTTDDCTLDEDVAATVSFRMASRQADSAVVEAAPGPDYTSGGTPPAARLAAARNPPDGAGMDTTDGRDPIPMPLVKRRDQIIDTLCRQVATDALTLDEFERRVDIAHRAATAAELEALVADLPAAEPPAEGPVARVTPVPHEVEGRPDHQFVVAVMGGVDRKGGWVPAGRSSIFAIMGGALLDFREALLPPGVTEVTVYTFWGGVEIIVPPGLAVESSGIAIMGGFGHADNAARTADPDTPVLRIRGVVVMGDVDIQVRLPGESARDARRRHREERRLLRNEQRRLRG